MKTREELVSDLERILSELVVVPEGHVISQFLVIVETVDGESGEKDVVIDYSDTITSWSALGLLAWAEQYVWEGEEDE